MISFFIEHIVYPGIFIEFDCLVCQQGGEPDPG